jgi:hypothetical protein
MNTPLLADEELPAEGSALRCFLWVRGNDDVDGCSWFHYHTHFVLAVIAVLAQQEETRRDRPLRQLQRQEGHRGTFERQNHLSVLAGENSAEVELTWQF